MCLNFTVVTFPVPAFLAGGSISPSACGLGGLRLLDPREDHLPFSLPRDMTVAHPLAPGNPTRTPILAQAWSPGPSSCADVCRVGSGLAMCCQQPRRRTAQVIAEMTSKVRRRKGKDSASALLPGTLWAPWINLTQKQVGFV